MSVRPFVHKPIQNGGVTLRLTKGDAPRLKSAFSGNPQADGPARFVASECRLSLVRDACPEVEAHGSASETESCPEVCPSLSGVLAKSLPRASVLTSTKSFLTLPSPWVCWPCEGPAPWTSALRAVPVKVPYPVKVPLFVPTAVAPRTSALRAVPCANQDAWETKTEADRGRRNLGPYPVKKNGKTSAHGMHMLDWGNPSQRPLFNVVTGAWYWKTIVVRRIHSRLF